MTRHRLQIEELESRHLPSGAGATVTQLPPRAIHLQVTVQLCVDGNSVPATLSVQAVLSGHVVSTPNGGLHEQIQIDIPRTVYDVAGQEFTIEGHRDIITNISPSGASNFTNVFRLEVTPDEVAACSDAVHISSVQHQTINANGVLTASVGDTGFES